MRRTLFWLLALPFAGLFGLCVLIGYVAAGVCDVLERWTEARPGKAGDRWYWLGAAVGWVFLGATLWGWWWG